MLFIVTNLSMLSIVTDLSWDEATLISKEIKSLAIAVLELCFSEGISESVKKIAKHKFLKIRI